jgi:hypothetical protein
VPPFKLHAARANKRGILRGRRTLNSNSVGFYPAACGWLRSTEYRLYPNHSSFSPMSAFLVPLSMRHNKISTVVIGTSIVYSVKQGSRNLVRVSVVSHSISVAMKLDRAMIISHFDSRQMGVQKRSMLGRLGTAR